MSKARTSVASGTTTPPRGCRSFWVILLLDCIYLAEILQLNCTGVCKIGDRNCEQPNPNPSPSPIRGDSCHTNADGTVHCDNDRGSCHTILTEPFTAIMTVEAAEVVAKTATSTLDEPSIAKMVDRRPATPTLTELFTANPTTSGWKSQRKKLRQLFLQGQEFRRRDV
ncbi:hypothetical protein BJ742DRAFT_484049 [Cladochytrium replicatum]|nr:hypothetical protein BJ742DRAFT_484049 [Cladochytrium replicatum]